MTGSKSPALVPILRMTSSLTRAALRSRCLFASEQLERSWRKVRKERKQFLRTSADGPGDHNDITVQDKRIAALYTINVRKLLLAGGRRGILLAADADAPTISPSTVNGIPPACAFIEEPASHTRCFSSSIQTSERAERWLTPKPRYCSTVEIPKKLSASEGSLVFSMGKQRIHR